MYISIYFSKWLYLFVFVVLLFILGAFRHTDILEREIVWLAKFVCVCVLHIPTPLPQLHDRHRDNLGIVFIWGG